MKKKVFLISIRDQYLKNNEKRDIQFTDKNSSFKIVNENDLIHKILSFLSEHRVQYNLNTQVKNTLQMRIQKCIKQKIFCYTF